MGPPVQSELILHFVRNQVEAHRGAAAFERGAITFAVTREADGLMELWSLVVTPNHVTLERGPVPIQYKGPTAVLYMSDADLVAVTRGESPAGLDAEGSADLVKKLAICFRPTMTLVGARAT